MQVGLSRLTQVTVTHQEGKAGPIAEGQERLVLPMPQVSRNLKESQY